MIETKPGTKIVVLTSGSYSGYHIIGAFSSMEQAKAYAEYARLSADDDMGFEEYELDEERKAQWRTVYGCSIDIDGKVWREWTNEELVEDRLTRERSDRHAFTFESTVSAEHALKLCAEARQKWLAGDQKTYWEGSKDKRGLSTSRVMGEREQGFSGYSTGEDARVYGFGFKTEEELVAALNAEYEFRQTATTVPV